MGSLEKKNKKQPVFSPLRQERELRGWSRSYVAEQLEVDIMTVGRWERGERLPHPDHRQKLCDLFKKNAQELGLLQEIDNGSDEQEDTSVLSPQIPPENVETEGIYSRWYPHRRKILIGLAGLTVTALAGSIWAVNQKQRSPAVPVKPVVSKRLYQLIDPNTRNWINQLAYSPDGSMLAAASGSNTVLLWNIHNHAVVQYYPTLNQWVNDVSWSQTNLLAAACGDLTGGTVQVWRFSEKKPLFTLKKDYSMRTVAWSPRQEYLALAGHATTIEIWNPIESRPISAYSYSDQNLPGINKVTWSFDARYIASADDSGTIHVWEALTGKPVTRYHKHQSRVVDIVWSPGTYLIASASTDKTVHVWNALKGQTIVTYAKHKDEVHGIDWSPNGTYLASGSYDTTVQIWEALTGKHADTYTGCHSKILTIRWSNRENLIFLGSQEQGIEVLQVTR